jgi:hypothetical protein
MQQAPLQAFKSQTNFFSNRSKETTLSWISINMEGNVGKGKQKK